MRGNMNMDEDDYMLMEKIEYEIALKNAVKECAEICGLTEDKVMEIVNDPEAIWPDEFRLYFNQLLERLM
jgi:hypothetical protein